MIDIKVIPHSHTLKYYCIKYRYKWKLLNFLNPYRMLVQVWDGATLDYDQPVMFDHFNDAYEYAKKLKNNPNLIKKHYEKQDKIYRKAKKRRKKYIENRNKSVKL